MSRILFSKENLFFYFLSILAGISFVLKGSLSNDMISDLGFSHYVSYISNIIIIILIGMKVGRGIHIRNHLVVRLGNQDFMFFQNLTAILMMFFYLCSQYGLSFILSTIESTETWRILSVFLITNTCVMFIIVVIIGFMNLGLKRIWALLLSISINLLYHYGFVIGNLTKIYYDLKRG